ncbi:Transposable element Tcb1 transposase, partial [Stegodyphus mimosarum]
MNQGATKSVSQSTIQRTLLRLGLRSRRLVRAPMLTAVHRRRRLEFARQYSSWTSTEWRQVAFSDESRFMLHRTDGRWRIRRETSERNHPATIAGTVQAGGGSIMVWGMFSWHSLGSLIIVEGTMDQYKYASVLADHVHPYMRIVFPQDDGIFQQDNARCHTAASVRAWFEEHQDEFTVLPWPANSPDLNPIEHLWDHLDRVVRAMDPQPRNLAQLATALESAWLNIPENTFRDLCDSLPARLAAVRSAKVTDSVIELGKTCFGAPAFGYTLAKISEWILVRIYISPVSEMTITFVFAYATYLTAERFLGISAVVAVVLYGITLSGNKMCISPKSESLVHTLLKIMAVWQFIYA